MNSDFDMKFNDFFNQDDVGLLPKIHQEKQHHWFYIHIEDFSNRLRISPWFLRSFCNKVDRSSSSLEGRFYLLWSFSFLPISQRVHKSQNVKCGIRSYLGLIAVLTSSRFWVAMHKCTMYTTSAQNPRTHPPSPWSLWSRWNQRGLLRFTFETRSRNCGSCSRLTPRVLMSKCKFQWHR
jgi:hypothetical protein